MFPKIIITIGMMVDLLSVFVVFILLSIDGNKFGYAGLITILLLGLLAHWRTKIEEAEEQEVAEIFTKPVTANIIRDTEKNIITIDTETECEKKFTKSELAAYYRSVANWLEVPWFYKK